jgi:hypothetical protein
MHQLHRLPESVIAYSDLVIFEVDNDIVRAGMLDVTKMIITDARLLNMLLRQETHEKILA